MAFARVPISPQVSQTGPESSGAGWPNAWFVGRFRDSLEEHVGNRPVRNVQRHIESRLMVCEVTAVTYGGCYRRVLPVSESGK